MTPSKKRTPTRGGYALSRPKADEPRLNYFVTNVTAQEKRAIDEHCRRRGISVSGFLANLILNDARKPRGKEKIKEVTLTLQLTPREIEKLQIFARVQQKTMADLLHDGLGRSLRKRQTPSSVEWEPLRCWLSKDEHATIKKYLRKNRLAARTYLATLALRAIKKSGT